VALAFLALANSAASSMISLAYVEEDGLLLSAAFLAAIILMGIASVAVWGAIVGAIIIAN
jgi:O-antigen ligase